MVSPNAPYSASGCRGSQSAPCPDDNSLAPPRMRDFRSGAMATPQPEASVFFYVGDVK